MSRRRNLLRASAALLVLSVFAAGTAKAEELDRELLQMCDDFTPHTRAKKRLTTLDDEVGPSAGPARRPGELSCGRIDSTDLNSNSAAVSPE